MVLIPEIVDAVRSVPVVRAGGIGRGRQMAAAMALGAQGVWCGSVWLTTNEAETHPVVKQKFLAATSSDTVRSQLAHRQAGVSCVPPGPTSGTTPTTRSRWACRCSPSWWRRRKRISRAAYKPGSGAEQLSNYFVGQIVGSMNVSKPAAQVVFGMVDEFIEAVQSLGRLLETLSSDGSVLGGRVARPIDGWARRPTAPRRWPSPTTTTVTTA